MTPGAQEVVDELACEALLRAGSKSFHAASRLLPARIRGAVRALYAFCRIADDDIDDLPQEQTGAKLAALARLQRRLDAIYADTPRDRPSDRAFARVVRRHRIPRELPEALLDGMRWDAEARTIEDESALYAYSARVAAAVGVMMTLLMGERRADVLARACDLGVAMQLTNIARDVGEDARHGRMYLPRTWLNEAGIDRDAWLASPTHNAALAGVVARVLQRADELYARADVGIAQLPRDCRRAIWAARTLYSAIGNVIRRARFDSVSSRAVVSAPRKLWLLLRALVRRTPPAGAALLHAPALAETRFLIEAAR